MILLAFAFAAVLGEAATSLSLDDAIQRATHANPQVRAASADAARAATVDKQAIALFLPTVEGRATWQDNDKKLLGTATFGTTSFDFLIQPHWMLNYQLTATQNLALYGPAFPLLHQAQAGTRAASAAESEARTEVAFAVVRAYYAALEADALASVALETGRGAEESLRHTIGRREAGRATEAEVLRAKVRVGETRLATATARRASEEAHETLADLLGDHGPFELTRPPRPSVDPGVEAGPEVLARRPDLATTRELVAGAREGRAAAARAWYPTLSASVFYAGVKSSEAAGLTQTPDHFALLAVATLPIFDGNLKYWQLREKTEAQHAAEARASAATAAAGADLRRARRAVIAAREKESLSREQLGLAAKADELVHGQYDAGAATQLEILDADSALAVAKRESIAAELDADVAALDLKRAMGMPLSTGGTP